jgi:hypothetical protein
MAFKSLPVSSPAKPFITESTTMRLATPNAMPSAAKAATQRVKARCCLLKLSRLAMSTSIDLSISARWGQIPSYLSHPQNAIQFRSVGDRPHKGHTTDQYRAPQYHHKTLLSVLALP